MNEDNYVVGKTILNEEHRRLGGKMVNFAGWDMPVEYSGLRLEHMATRNSVGLFDVSHMGEVMVEGENSLAFLQKILTNEVSKCAINQAQYNMMLDESGFVIDDLIIYRLAEKKYLLVVNASNKNKDVLWIQKVAKTFKNLSIEDQSSDWAQIAIQGPKAVEVSKHLFSDCTDIKRFRFKEYEWNQARWLVARTGYTGEDGFEIYGPLNQAANLWNELLVKGQPYGILPCGLGARNTLRIEAGLPLYGNEIQGSRLPLNVGMNWVLKVNKESEFFGQTPLKKAILTQNSANTKNLVGLVSMEKAIPRDGYRVLSFDKTQIGEVTSGTYSPSLNQPIGMALVDKSYVGEKCLIEVRKNLVEAKIVNLPFVKKK